MSENFNIIPKQNLIIIDLLKSKIITNKKLIKMIELPFECMDFLSLGEINDLIDSELITCENNTELMNKIQFIQNNFPKLIIDLFGIKFLLDADILDRKNSYIGNTDYIDRIKPNDIKSKISI